MEASPLLFSVFGNFEDFFFFSLLSGYVSNRGSERKKSDAARGMKRNGEMERRRRRSRLRPQNASFLPRCLLLLLLLFSRAPLFKNLYVKVFLPLPPFPSFLDPLPSPGMGFDRFKVFKNRS